MYAPCGRTVCLPDELSPSGGKNLAHPQKRDNIISIKIKAARRFIKNRSFPLLLLFQTQYTFLNNRKDDLFLRNISITMLVPVLCHKRIL
jgi:hypothetical protein